MRTTVGPFSLNTDQALDKRIVALFDGVRSRGKAELFRQIMAAYLDNQGQRVVEKSALEVKVDRLLELIQDGVKLQPVTNFDIPDAELDAELINKAEDALDALGL